jgi:protein-S-isoprenylcysteine O-methyltransferase Ste14
LLQVRLALAEEPFLTQRFGEPYVEYRKAVPRFLPSPTPRVSAAGKRAQWLQGVFGEIYMLGVVITFVVFGWQFNATTLIRGVLISLGAWLIVKAVLPKPKESNA